MKFFLDNMKCLESATVLCSNRNEKEEERNEDSSKPERNFFKSQLAHIFRYFFFKSRTYIPAETMLRRTT